MKRIILFLISLATIFCGCTAEDKSDIWNNTDYSSDSADIVLECETIDELKNFTDNLDFFKNPNSVTVSLLTSDDETLNFDFPKHFTSLKKVTLSKINSLNCLGAFNETALEELHINSFGFVDFPNAKVNRIFLSQCKNINWETLENISELQYLYVSNSDSLPNFNVLSEMDKIETVWLEYSAEEWENMDISCKEISTAVNSDNGKLVLTDTVPEWFNVKFADSFLEKGNREIIIRISP